MNTASSISSSCHSCEHDKSARLWTLDLLELNGEGLRKLPPTSANQNWRNCCEPLITPESFSESF
jgi:hypothetical protein